ncbi:MAG: hypothetical protein FH747_04645 [Stenotrophomonas sp.]|uniref:hypothetical protein n=1 Tax=Stenotrophomonas sp. TaxID=69392 RepID=UPI0013526A91|nr:hypothetical protein [Stenotrophomonas sp.]MTI72934.1 hypothetical protein [Stenotrophomonas sp.]
MESSSSSGKLLFPVIFAIIAFFGFKACTKSNSKNETVRSVETVEEIQRKDDLKKEVAKMIKGKGLWCERISDITPNPFSQSPNKQEFSVLCDDGTTAVNYELVIFRDNTFSVREK